MEAGNSNDRLKERITAWRVNMLQTDLSNDEVDELQSHLEDSIEEFLNKNLPEDEAWLLAINRMGSVKAIEREFGKVKDARASLLKHLLFWSATLFVLLGICLILTEVALNISNMGAIRIGRFGMLMTLTVIFFVLIGNRREWLRIHFIAGAGLAFLLYFFMMLMGFFTSLESPWCTNTNPIFANNPSSSEVYKKELLRIFAKLGTENLYYLYKVHYSENNQHYIIVKAVGKDFCAEFPVNFTNSKKWKFLRETVPPDHLDCELQGLKFDVVVNPSGTEFVFRDLAHIAD